MDHERMQERVRDMRKLTRKSRRCSERAEVAGVGRNRENSDDDQRKGTIKFAGLRRCLGAKLFPDGP
jgi:hypothetical protein